MSSKEALHLITAMVLQELDDANSTTYIPVTDPSNGPLKSFPFLDLPAEVRKLIYKAIFSSGLGSRLNSDTPRRFQAVWYVFILTRLCTLPFPQNVYGWYWSDRVR